MWLLLTATLVSLVMGTGLFALIFKRRRRWGWGYLFALICNIPTIVLVCLVVSTRDSYVTIASEALIGLGLGGFGIGAIAGMITVTVLGSPRSCDP